MTGPAGFLLPAKSCACTHLRSTHIAGACTFHGCGCLRARLSLSLADGVLAVLRVVRGW